VKQLAVCQVDQPGGAEIGLLRLLRRLEARDWEISVTSPGEAPTGVMSTMGWPWHALELGGLAHGAGARAVGSWPRARRLARDQDFTYLNGTVAGRLLPALIGRPTVLHVHDVVARVPRHWHGADLVLADSHAIARRLDPLEVHVVGAPVELDPPEAAPPWGQGDGRPVVGFVGRLEERKGPLDLCLAAPAIRARHPDARIVIVGDDVHAVDPRYAARVRAAPGVEQVRWVHDAASLMRHLDVLVLPSHEEPFATVVAEAMAAGTPVVATDVDSVPEIVENGTSGILVARGDVRALAEAVSRVLDDRPRMSAAARQAAQRFDADRSADVVEGLLRGVTV
jgi:glycosyltransferase involved in cell wall biosynthesis